MKEKKELYQLALDLLEKCNVTLKDDPELSTINSLLASVVKNLNNTVVNELTGIKTDTL
jgi:hypothetical protein